MSQLRAMIREILAEELGGLRERPAGPRVREEIVAIRNNSELAAFVRRILEMAQDGQLRADIAAGRHVFKLTAETLPPFQAHRPVSRPPDAPPEPVFFETGLVSGKDIAGLPQGTRRLTIGRAVTITPLARDELRRKGIEIDRSSA